MEIDITWYSDALRPQVIDLFVSEYGVERKAFDQLFERFYLHPFQKDKCLLVVALDGNTVAGFQSFFFWPYTFNGKTYNSFQSGNSLVHPGYRGKGIFNKMLSFIDEENKTRDIDFLMGFPVEASLKNFIKDKWTNILDLRWYIKLCNPFAFFPFRSGNSFEKGCIFFGAENPEKSVLRLSASADFTGWRREYLSGNYYSYRYTAGNEEIIFHLKTNKRKKVLNELIIGNILFKNELSIQHLSAALKSLDKAASRTFATHFISIAVNEACSIDLRTALLNTSFKRTEKSIYFIVKPFKDNNFVLQPAHWLLYRSDIDTW